MTMKCIEDCLLCDLEILDFFDFFHFFDFQILRIPENRLLILSSVVDVNLTKLSEIADVCVAVMRNTNIATKH
jgi:hypothetical protein